MPRVLKYVLNCEQRFFFHFSYYNTDYPTSRLTVTGLARVHSIAARMLHLGSFISGAHWLGGQMGPRGTLDALVGTEIRFSGCPGRSLLNLPTEPPQHTDLHCLVFVSILAMRTRKCACVQSPSKKIIRSSAYCRAMC
jgi:hypothetical protein